MSETTEENSMSINGELQPQQPEEEESTSESFLDTNTQDEEIIEEHIVSKSDDESNYMHEEVSVPYAEEVEMETAEADDEDDEMAEEEDDDDEDDGDETEEDSVLANGLDPMATHLISSSGIVATAHILPQREQTPPPPVPNEFIVSKIAREVRNLQTNANNSEDLYSKLSLESPRRAKKLIELTPDDVMEDDDKSSEAPKSPMFERSVSSTSDSTTKRDSPLKTNGTARKSYVRVPVKRRRKNARDNDESVMNSDMNETEDLEDDETETEQKSESSMQISFDQKNSKPPKAGWDSFCFKCHNNSGIISLACSKCRCSYHRICVRNNPIPKSVDEFVCPECRETELAESSSMNKYGHERIDPRKLSEMLGVILSKLQDANQPYIDQFKNEITQKSKDSSAPLIVNNMSFSIMEARIRENFYSTSESFIHDFKVLEHNWTIVNPAIGKSLKTLINKIVLTEINELESCVHCYEDSFYNHDWFVRVCKRPHLLVWAKLKGYPYWPAKIMSVDNQRQQADVRFFGAHDRANVPTNACMLFCDKDPNKVQKESITAKPPISSKTQKGFADALKEKDVYIENLRKKYGFNSAPFKTLLDGSNLTNQLEMLLPGYREIKEEKETQKEKLTLKLVKRQSSKGYQVEQKEPELRRRSTSTNSRESKTHYKVVANDVDDVQPTKKLHMILKRSINDKDVELATTFKKQKIADDVASEPSENSNMSSASSKKLEIKPRGKPGRKKIIRNDPIRKSLEMMVPSGTNEITKLKDESDAESQIKTVMKCPTLPGTRGRKRAQSTFHRRQSLESDSKRLHHLRRSSVTTYDKKMNKAIEVVRASSSHVKTRASDASTKKNGIEVRTTRSERRKAQLIATPPTEPGKRHRRKPHVVDPVVNSTPKPSAKVSEKKISTDKSKRAEEQPIVSIEKIPKPSKSKETSPSVQNEATPLFKEPTPEITTNGTSSSNIKENANGFDSKLVIKTEPVSDNEDNASTVDSERSSTVNSFASMVSRMKPVQKSLAMSSNNNVFDDNARPKAKKSFLNNINGKQVEKLTQNNWMTSIPGEVVSCQSSRAASPANSISISNRSSPEATTSAPHQVTIHKATITQQHPPLLTSNPIANVTPITYTAPSSRSSSQQVSPSKINVPPPPQIAVTNPTRTQEVLPILIPKPQGAFAFEGTSSSADIGPVSRMLTDNAYRITDFFRNVLVETVNSFKTDYPIAENLMLRSENEKLLREMQTVKSACQQNMHELRREHQEELEDIKKKYEDHIENLKKQHANELHKVRQEIRAQCEVEKARAIDNTKRELKNTTWCAMCKKEAKFYCCWNTSYCGQGCQRNHWQSHQKSCTNKNSVQDIQQSIPQHHIIKQQQQMKQIQLQQQQQNQLNQQQIQTPQLLIRSPQQVAHPQINANTIFIQQVPVQRIILPQHPRNSGPQKIMQYPEKKIYLQAVNSGIGGEEIQLLPQQNADLVCATSNTLSTVTSTTTGQE